MPACSLARSLVRPLAPAIKDDRGIEGPPAPYVSIACVCREPACNYDGNCSLRLTGPETATPGPRALRVALGSAKEDGPYRFVDTRFVDSIFTDARFVDTRLRRRMFRQSTFCVPAFRRIIGTCFSVTI